MTLLSNNNKIQLTINYLLYPGLPVIRKSLQVKNLSKETIKLESIDIEKFEVVEYSASTFSWFVMIMEDGVLLVLMKVTCRMH
ncbi:MAG: hypothetical protein WDO19_19200 [Bacteroidota bacterium]